ncbi:hypothetical protein CBS101457_001169 [Exobasidium rhododendri]|nr:hypothetical protein CBS101457_001169 [Exobasidium rhododendri]
MNAASPFRTSLDDRARPLHVTDFCSVPYEEGLRLDWKTPKLKKAVKIVPQGGIGEEDDDDNDDSSVVFPSLPTLSWRAPASSVRSEPPEVMNFSASSPRESGGEPSSSSYAYERDAEEASQSNSVLQEDEIQKIPPHRLHRSEIGLSVLDELFGSESGVCDDEESKKMGMAPGRILEVAGTPGSGKTTLLIQIAVLERLNGILRLMESAEGKGKMKEATWMALGDNSPKVMIIDTEGGVGMDRIVDIAEHHITVLTSTPTLSPSHKTDLLRSVLIGIEYCRCTTNYELLALLIALMPNSRPIPMQKGRLAEDKEKDEKQFYSPLLPERTTLVVIDTISSMVRSPIPDEAPQLRKQRNHLIKKLKQFSESCNATGIKLIVSNQMRLTFVDKDGHPSRPGEKGAQGMLVPSLSSKEESVSILGRDIWRLLLFRDGPQGSGTCNRFAHIINHPPLIRPREQDQETCMQIKIESGGIRSHSY